MSNNQAVQTDDQADQTPGFSILGMSTLFSIITIIFCVLAIILIIGNIVFWFFRRQPVRDVAMTRLLYRLPEGTLPRAPPLRMPRSPYIPRRR